MHGSQSQRGTQHVETADSTVRRLPGRVRVEDSGRTRQSRAVGPGGRPPPCPDAGPIWGTVPVLGLYVPSLWVPLPRGVILTCGHQGRHSAWRLGWASDCLDLSTGLPVGGSAAQCEVRAQVCGGGSGPQLRTPTVYAVVEPGWPQTPALLCTCLRWCVLGERHPPVSLQGPLTPG